MRRFILGWKALGHERRFQARIVNYADDLVICCRRNAEQAMDAMRSIFRKLKLTVNEEKTHVCQVPQDSFDFLGYTFGRFYSTRTGNSYVSQRPSKRKIQAVCRRISEATDRKWCGRDTEEQVGQLNRIMVGWANYFCQGPVGKPYRIVTQHACKKAPSRGCVGSTRCRRDRRSRAIPINICIVSWDLSCSACATATFRGRQHESLSESRMRKNLVHVRFE